MAKEEDILKELRQLNSPLAGYSRAMPYEVPDGYFDTFANDVTRHMVIGTSAKENPFSVPDGYFDALPAQLLQQVAPAKTTTPSRSIGFVVRRIAVAALVVLGISIGTYRIFSEPKQGLQEQLNNIPDAELLAYVQEHAHEFETETIINNLSDMNITTTQNTGINHDAIEDYLEQTEWQ